MIEGRDIGTVVAPAGRGQGLPVADPAVRARRREAERPEIGADALATDLKLRDESDQARMQPAEDAEQIDTTELGIDEVVAGSRNSYAPAGRPSCDGLRRPRLADLAAVARAARPRLLTRARAYGLERIPARGRLRARDQPPRLGRRPPRRRRFRRATSTTWPRSSSRPFPGFGRYLDWHGIISDPPRRVRPRRGAADAQLRRRRAARSASSSRAPGSAAAGRGTAQPGAAMVAIQEQVPVVPIAVYGTQFWRPGNFAPCSIAVGEPVRFERPQPGRPRLPRGEVEIERRINVLFDWLAEVHARGRPRGRDAAAVSERSPRPRRRPAAIATTSSGRSRSWAFPTSASRR